MWNVQWAGPGPPRSCWPVGVYPGVMGSLGEVQGKVQGGSPSTRFPPFPQKMGSLVVRTLADASAPPERLNEC